MRESTDYLEPAPPIRCLIYGLPPILGEMPAETVGHLLHPRQGNNLDRLLADGLPWASDNGAFSDHLAGRPFDGPAFEAYLDRLAGRPGCLWVACPDVPMDAAATLELFKVWAPKLRRRGLPVALVAQDGLEPRQVDWQAIDALFVGGSTEWKLGPDAQHLCRHARAWEEEDGSSSIQVHVGRVNSKRRVLESWSLLGADTFDGMSYNRWARVKLDPITAYALRIADPEHQADPAYLVDYGGGLTFQPVLDKAFENCICDLPLTGWGASVVEARMVSRKAA